MHNRVPIWLQAHHILWSWEVLVEGRTDFSTDPDLNILGWGRWITNVQRKYKSSLWLKVATSAMIAPTPLHQDSAQRWIPCNRYYFIQRQSTVTATWFMKTPSTNQTITFGLDKSLNRFMHAWYGSQHICKCCSDCIVLLVVPFSQELASLPINIWLNTTIQNTKCNMCDSCHTNAYQK